MMPPIRKISERRFVLYRRTRPYVSFLKLVHYVRRGYTNRECGWYRRVSTTGTQMCRGNWFRSRWEHERRDANGIGFVSGPHTDLRRRHGAEVGLRQVRVERVSDP